MGAAGTSASLTQTDKPDAAPRASPDERGRPRYARALGLAAGLLALGAASEASAQKATGALDRFDPAPAADGFLAVPEPHVPGDFRPGVALAFSFASSPLVVEVTEGDQTKEVAILSHQATLHTLLSLEILRTVKVELDIPATLSQGGEAPPPEAARFPAPSGPSFNDLRTSARVELFHQRGSIPSVALAMALWFPTGNEAELTGSGSFRYAPSIIVGGTSLRYLWSVTFSRRFQPDSPEALLGSELLLGAAAGFKFGPFQVGAEVFASTVADARTSAFSGDTTGLEALASGRVAFGPVTAGAGFGVGLTDGFGTPSLRVIGSVGYAPPPPKEWPTANTAWGAAGPDGGGAALGVRGGDPKTKKPPAKAPPDKDGDKVPDAEDACPDVVGAPNESSSKRGCPPDGDADGIIDAEDRCPKEAGTDSPDPSRVGCPADTDTDGDGIIDRLDACPGEKGPEHSEPAKNGCAKVNKVFRVEGEQIVLLQQIRFVSARDIVDAESEKVLDELARLLVEHPEIARVAVDGHTDNAGPEAANIALSQRRAIAVMKGLIARGIDARRLEARGFGPRRPIAPNDTDEGRAKNRRVEFQIRKKTALGEAGWVDGPIE